MWKLLTVALFCCYFAWIYWMPTSTLPPPMAAADLLPRSARDSIEAYVTQCAPLAVQEMNRTGIPASIKLGQALLESRFGSSPLAQQANNHFGIKAEPHWDNKARHCTYSYEWSPKRERMVPVLSCFRRYTDLADCFKGHSEFLRSRAHYAPLFDLSIADVQGWAEGLQRSGYATDPQYAQKLLGVIKKYELTRFDRLEQ